MLLIRLLFILLLAFIAWRVYRLFRPRIRQARQEHVEKMVCCATCQTHVPTASALRAGDLWYCCEAHRDANTGGNAGERQE